MRIAVLFAAAFGLALAACRSPTQIEVEVSTNVACADWQGAAVAVGQLGSDLESAIPSTTSSTCDATGHVGTVVVIPAGADNANVAIKVVGAVGAPGVVAVEDCTADAGYANCIVARRALRFIPHESLSLAVPLEQVCDNDPCAPDQTCVAGQCKSATVPDPTQCENQTCGEGVLPGVDGGISDGGGDATINDGGSGGDATTPEAGGGEDGSAGDSAAPPYDAAFAGCGAHCALALGEGNTCVAREGGVVCAGANFLGELGTSTSGSGPVAVHLDGLTPLTGVTGIVSGEDSSCAYLEDGGTACWGGASPFGLTDGGAFTYAQTAVPNAGSPQIAIGNFFMCWVTASRLLRCEGGINGNNEVVAFDGDASVVPITKTVAPPTGTLPPFFALHLARDLMCALTADGTVYCQGDNTSGSESDPGGGESQVTSFTQVQTGALDLAVTESAACARVAGRILCWGDLPGAPTSAISEVTFANGTSIATATELAAGLNHECVLLGGAQAGEVACWGDNSTHQLGLGDDPSTGGGTRGTAALVVGPDGGGVFQGATAIAGGKGHTCALVSDGSLWCWGDNEYGQVLPGGANAYSTPTRSGF